MTFSNLLAANPALQRVGFYRLTCKEHGVFRLLANGIVPRCCPWCSQPAKLGRVQNVICATRRPVPMVQRWRSDNTDGIRHQRPAWFRQSGEIEDCFTS